MDKVTKGELDEDVTMKDGGKDGEGKVDGEGAGGEQGGEQGEGGGKKVEEDVGVEPPSPEFILELPSISAIDLCVVFRVSIRNNNTNTNNVDGRCTVIS